MILSFFSNYYISYAKACWVSLNLCLNQGSCSTGFQDNYFGLRYFAAITESCLFCFRIFHSGCPVLTKFITRLVTRKCLYALGGLHNFISKITPFGRKNELNTIFHMVSAVSSASLLAFWCSQVQFPGPAHSFTSCQLLVKG